ncbi:MAG: hypothetical protein NT062_12130 [Proteobacteria bacterium]|nr:hypothetical protein [Pseudomonadota bacterium]
MRWRAIGAPTWTDVAFQRSSTGSWFARIPAAHAPGVEYYIRGVDRSGAEVAHFASALAPHVVRVDPELADRLETLDLARLGRRNEVSVSVIGHDFGNRYGVRDRFVRGELIYSYRMLRTLHEVGFGFGTIGGHTPTMSTPDTTDVYRGMRYGFGQLRLRVDPSVFIDGRLGFGVTQDAFEANGRLALTFGKPWRSNVQVGGEYIGDLGPTGWVRLQWDSAAPVLMGASVVRTDLPGALISPGGLYIAYDIALTIQGLTLRGQVSYGARDGSAYVGGGLGTAVAF